MTEIDQKIFELKNEMSNLIIKPILDEVLEYATKLYKLNYLTKNEYLKILFQLERKIRLRTDKNYTRTSFKVYVSKDFYRKVFITDGYTVKIYDYWDMQRQDVEMRYPRIEKILPSWIHQLKIERFDDFDTPMEVEYGELKSEIETSVLVLEVVKGKEVYNALLDKSLYE